MCGVFNIAEKLRTSGRLRSLRRHAQAWTAHTTHNVARWPKKKLYGKAIKAFWYNAETNFGDAITPALLEYYGYTPMHTFPANAELVSTGSILQILPDDFSGTILGSGLISEQKAKRFESATILGVRGSLTRDLIQAPTETVLGDPGLLLPQLLKAVPPRKYLLGLVPHYHDKQNKALQKICLRYPSQVTLIDVQRDPVTVLERIAECEYILSSSLHGVVVADALGRPNGWLVLSEKVRGNGFKFRDYFSAFNCTREAITLTGGETLEQLVESTAPPPLHVAVVRERLDNLFRDLVHLVE